MNSRWQPLVSIAKGIDIVTEKIGRAASFLMLVLGVEITYDVVLRYVFDAPTKWSYDISYMLAGTVIMLTAPWVLKNHGHVSLDLLSQRFSPRTKRILEIVFMAACFFPLVAFLSHYSFKVTLISLMCNETSSVSYWRPVIWPFRLILLAGLLLLLVQGLANLVHAVFDTEGDSHD